MDEPISILWWHLVYFHYKKQYLSSLFKKNCSTMKTAKFLLNRLLNRIIGIGLKDKVIYPFQSI